MATRTNPHFNLYLPTAQMDDLRQLSKLTGRSIQSICRDALQHELNRYGQAKGAMYHALNKQPGAPA